MTPTKTQTRGTAEGNAAANRIREFRQNVNNGATAKEARATLRDIKAGPTTPVVTPTPVPTTPGPITTATLAPTTPMKLGEPTPATQATGMMEEFADTNDTYTRDLEAKAEALNAPAKTAFADYLSQLQNAKGQTQLTSEAYAQEGGVDAITPELNDINDKIRREQLNMRRRTEAIQAGGGLKAGAASEIANIERDSFAKQADLSIVQLAVQGRYDSAKEIADRAVTAQLEKQTNDLAILKFNYDENKELFTKAEQRAFEAAQGDRERKLEAEKQDKQDKYNLGIQASADGAPSSVVQKMFQAKTREEALAIGGSYIGALDRAVKQSQLYTSSLQQQKLLAELNPTDTGNSGDLVAYAQQFADTGKLPSVAELKQSGLSVSQVTEYAKQAPKAEGSLLSSSTGIRSSALSPAQEDGINALNDIRKKVAELKTLDQERQKGVTSAIAGKIFGSEDQQRYIDLRGEIVDLLARARTGAALTTQEEKFYASQLPGRIGQVGVLPGTGAGLFGVNSQNRIDNFEKKITGTLDTKLSGTGTVIQGYTKVKVPSLGDKTVGEIVDIGGTQYRVLADGTLTDVI